MCASPFILQEIWSPIARQAFVLTRREFSLNTQFAKIGPSMLEEFSISDRIWAGIYPLLREKHKENSDLIRLSGKNRYYSPSV